jgi:hypothetical protein
MRPVSRRGLGRSLKLEVRHCHSQLGNVENPDRAVIVFAA